MILWVHINKQAELLYQAFHVKYFVTSIARMCCYCCRRLLYTTDPRCPKAKLSGNVPSLVLHISEKKVCQWCYILKPAIHGWFLSHDFIVLVLSKLDYGCATLAGLPATLLDRLQSVLNAAVRLIYVWRKYDHVTPLLRELHWLRVPKRITFQLATLAYRCQHNMVPHCLAVQLNRASSVASRRRLRSTSMPELIIPSTSRSTIGDRAFCVTAARAWNAWHRPCSPLSHLQFFNVAWILNCSRAPSQINYFSERSILHDSVYFTTLKSLDYNVVMTFRFNNNNHHHHLIVWQK